MQPKQVALLKKISNPILREDKSDDSSDGGFPPLEKTDIDKSSVRQLQKSSDPVDRRIFDIVRRHMTGEKYSIQDSDQETPIDLDTVN